MAYRFEKEGIMCGACVRVCCVFGLAVYEGRAWSSRCARASTLFARTKLKNTNLNRAIDQNKTKNNKSIY
jgi:hypothetical protein